MLGDITAADEIYIVTGRTDMRKSVNGRIRVPFYSLQVMP